MKHSILFFLLAALLFFIPAAMFAQYDVTIGNGASTNGSWSGGNPDVWTRSGSVGKVNKDEIVSRLNAGTSVTIYNGDGSIIDSAGIAIWKTSGGDATLTLKAYRASYQTSKITFGNNDTIASTSGMLTIIFNSDADANSDGCIQTTSTTSSSGCYFASNGGDIVFGGGADPYTTPAYGNTGTGGSAPGIVLSGVFINSGAGAVSIRGHGSTVGLGVELSYGTSIQATSGNIGIYGTGASDYAGGAGVRIYSDNTTIQSSDGAITITGIAGTGTSMSSDYAFVMTNASAIVSTNGNINITGTNPDGYSPAEAVWISGKDVNDPLIQTVNGTITIQSSTGSTTGSAVSSVYGMNLDNGGRIEATGTGSISITATNGSASNKQNLYGLYMSSQQNTPSYIQTNSGAISITATGGAGNTGGNGGIYMYSANASSASYIASTSGDIAIHATSNKGGRGIDMWGSLSYIQSSGDVDITTDAIGSGYSGKGLHLYNGSYVKTTGSGNLTINATGPVTGTDNTGITCYTQISTEAGNLTITGQGGGNDGYSNTGVDVYGGTISSSSGRVVINGTAGYGGTGVSLTANGSTIKSTTGSVYITGTGTGSNYGMGLYLTTGSMAGSLSGDTCFISATGTSNYSLQNSGTIGSSSFPGKLIIELGGSISDLTDIAWGTIRGSGFLTIRPSQASASIGLAGAGGTLALSTYEINSIQDGFHNVTFGRSDGTGDININERTFTDSLTLMTGSGSININGALSVGTNSLNISSDGIVSQSAGITADVLTLEGSGTFNLNTQNNVIGTLYGAANDIKLRDDAGITVGELNAANAMLSTNSAFTETGEFSVAGLTLGGSATYSLSDTVQKLTLSGTASLTLTGEFAADSLVMNGGNIDATSYTFSLGQNSSSGTFASRTSGTLLGTMKRWFTAVIDSNALLPIGNSSNYRPATISFTSAPSAGGSITAQFVASAPGTSGLPLTDSDDGVVSAMLTTGYWSLTAGDGLIGGTYNLDLNADGFSGVTEYDKVKLLKRTNSGSPWTFNGTHVTATGSNASPVAHRTGMSGLSEFGVAQSYIPTPVFSGVPSSISYGTTVINSTTVDSVKIKNIGTKVLNITSVTTDSASFVVSQGDTAVAIGDSVYYRVTFSPLTAGSKSDTLRIQHDASGSPFKVLLSGAALEAEPTTQASDISFSSVKDKSMTLHWTNGNGTSRIVIMNAGSAVSGLPSDGYPYTASSVYGSGNMFGMGGDYVVFCGTADSVEITGLTYETDYYVAVMEYNGTGGWENYLTASPLIGMQTTGARVITIWSKDTATVTFAKTDYADYTKEVNQDRLTDNVSLTRGDYGGIFNIKSESFYNYSSPAGTEWAYGTTADVATLTFDMWENTIGSNPLSCIGLDMVAHLIAEDIYVDIKFLSWTDDGCCGNGGGFSYIRGRGLFEVRTLSPANMTATSVTLKGEVYTTGTPARAYILYGTSSGVYTDSVLALPDSIPVKTATTVLANISGLTTGNTYYYCVAADNDTRYQRSNERSIFVVNAWSTDNGTVTFSKADGANCTMKENQDRISDDVWITRASTQGLFNIKSESSYDRDEYTSPAGTEWAMGTTADVGSLTFSAWRNAVDSDPPSSVGRDMVLHLTSENIYIDIEFTSWTSSSGGGFSYVRAGGPLEVRGFPATVTDTSATINAKVFSSRTHATAYVLYGTSNSSFTDSVIVSPDSIPAGVQTDVSATLPGLLGATTYYYCIAASNDGLYRRSAVDSCMTDAPVSVELVSFSAAPKQNNVELKWNTATELNSHGFEVERRTVGSQQLANGQKPTADSWSKVGFVEGAGNSNVPKEYSFMEKRVPNGKYEYRLKLVDNGGSFKYSPSVEMEMKFIPTVFALNQNYPNPFNPSTTINYQLPVTSNVELKVYDMLGREVATLVNGMQEAGSYDLKFDARGFASGLYFYRIHARQTEGVQAGDFVSIKKMLLVK